MADPREMPDRLFVACTRDGYAIHAFDERQHAAHLAKQEPCGGRVEAFVRLDVHDRELAEAREAGAKTERERHQSVEAGIRRFLGEYFPPKEERA